MIFYLVPSNPPALRFAPQAASEAPPAAAAPVALEAETADDDEPLLPARSAAPVGHWSPAVQERKERLWSGGQRVDEICDDILELEGHQLGNVASAVAERFQQLNRKLGAAA